MTNAARLSEFIIMAKNCTENPDTVWRSGQKNHGESVSTVIFHRDKNKYSVNKSKIIGSVTSPTTVLTLIWQVTVEVIIIPLVFNSYSGLVYKG